MKIISIFLLLTLFTSSYCSPISKGVSKVIKSLKVTKDDAKDLGAYSILQYEKSVARNLNSDEKSLDAIEIRLDSIATLHNNTFQCYYTLVNVSKDNFSIEELIAFKSEFHHDFLDFMKTDPNFEKHRKDKSKLIFSFRDKASNEMLKFDFDLAKVIESSKAEENSLFRATSGHTLVNQWKDVKLDSIATLSNNTFQYYYTLINVSPYNFDMNKLNELKSEFYHDLLNAVKTDPEFEKRRKAKSKLIFSFRDKVGNEMLKFDFDLAHIIKKQEVKK